MDDAPSRRRPILRWWMIPVTLLFATIAFSVVLSTRKLPESRDNRLVCSRNLRQIGLGVLLYANAHNGQFPDRLEDLLSNEIDLTPDVFVCPSSKDTPATTATTRQSATRLSSEPGHLSYIYLGKGLTNQAEATALVAYEPMNHHGDGCNMLFADGHVEYVASAQAKAIINQATSRPTTTATQP